VSNNEAYPLVTSTNSTGDTATQGFNTDVLESLDPANRQIVTDNLGLINTGKDVFYGSDFVHPEHIPQIAEALAHVTGKDDKTDLYKIAHALIDAQKQIANATWIRNLSPNQITTGGLYFPAPNGSTALAQANQVLAYDPQRYRVTLHPWVSGTGVTSTIWISNDQSGVTQTANGIPMGGFPLQAGNGNANNVSEFYWSDTMYASVDLNATVDTWLFYVIERYAD
jgi:hypothetical protein